MKKITVPLLLLCIILGTISCGNTGASDNSPSESTAQSAQSQTEAETQAEIKDEVPPIDFNGEEFNILLPDVTWTTPNIIADELLGERINDAQYATKLAIEERFNTTLTETYSSDMHYIDTLVNAGDDSFEVFSLDLTVVGLAQNGMIYNYSDLKYIDLEKPYWDQSLNKCLTIQGNTYFAFGAYDLSYYDLTHVLTFNKEMVSSYNLENPYDLGLVRKM